MTYLRGDDGCVENMLMVNSVCKFDKSGKIIIIN